MSFELQATSIFGTDFELRIATINNYPVEEIASVINSAYSKVPYLKKERITPEEVEKIICDKQKRLYLCISKTNNVAGTILLDFDQNNFAQNNAAELGLFSLSPTYQGKNIGSLFLKCVEQEAFSKVTKIYLNVIPFSQEKLLSFYKKNGYAPTGEKTAILDEQKAKYFKPEYHKDIYFLTYEKYNL